MNENSNELASFNDLADVIEQLLGGYGTPYRSGSGDFSLNHDYYGNHEIGVIFLKPIFTDEVMSELRSRIFPEFRDWEVWLTFNEGAEWHGHDQIVLSNNGWAVAPNDAD
jgi:hypothetical protein